MSRSPQASRCTTKCHSARLASATSDERRAQLTVFGSGCLAQIAGVELGQRGERRFKRAPEPAERRRLLPAELVREHVCR